MDATLFRRPLAIANIVIAAAMISFAGACAVSAPRADAAAKKPARVKIASVKSAQPGQLTVSVKKAKRAKGYQYRVGTDAKLAKDKKAITSKKRTATFSGLKQGKRYYIKVRAYSKKGKKKAWGKWSKAKSATVKAAPAPDPGPAVSASGVSGSCTWTLYSDGSLVVAPTDGASGALGTWPYDSGAPWSQHATSIKRAAFRGKVVAATCWDMFYGCSNLASIDLSGLDTSGVRDMAHMFRGCSSLTSLSLFGLDTSKVEDMICMFDSCSSLTSLDLFGFKTPEVTSMDCMFRGCSSLASLDLTGFDTSEAESMYCMFDGCSSLASLETGAGWSYGRVHNSAYRPRFPMSMRDGGGVLHEPEETIPEGAHTYTSVAASGVSGSCTWTLYEDGRLVVVPKSGASGALGTWTGESGAPWSQHAADIKQVAFRGEVHAATCRDMFKGCSNLASINLSGLKTSSVTDMAHMFDGCSKLEALDLSDLNTSQVEDMTNMFSGCSSLVSLDLTGLDTSGVQDMVGMFSGCSSLITLDLSGLKTSVVWNMTGMFDGCSSLASLDLSSFDMSQVESMIYMFLGCSSLVFLETGPGWSYKTGLEDSFKPQFPVDMRNESGAECPEDGYIDEGAHVYMVASAYDVSGGCTWTLCKDGSLVVAPTDGASGELGTWSDYTDVPWSQHASDIKRAEFRGGVAAATCQDMFKGCSNLASVDLSGLDASSVTDMSHMFDGCSSLASLDLSRLDTSQAAFMDNMFKNCSSLASLDLSRLDTSQAVFMDNMFRGCSELASLDLSGFDTSEVTDMSHMFDGCSSLASLDLSGLDTSAVEYMTNMFSGCSSLASLKTGAGWTYNTELEDFTRPQFPATMQDERDEVHDSGSEIPEGAHVYRAV